MHYIKEIFLGKSVDYIHSQFTRYGKGTFDGPALVVKNGSNIKAEGSIHYANILGEIIAAGANQNLNVSGIIYAKREIKIPLDVKKKTVKGDLHTAEVGETIHSDALKMIYDDYKDAYILLDLSASSGNWKLKSKKKPPKPGGKLDEKFCSATLEQKTLSNIMEEILFDAENAVFKQAELKHKITIDELVGTPELKKDPARFRTEAQRKGTIKRTLTIDGKTTETTHGFLA
jgi:hypothetical protein